MEFTFAQLLLILHALGDHIDHFLQVSRQQLLLLPAMVRFKAEPSFPIIPRLPPVEIYVPTRTTAVIFIETKTQPVHISAEASSMLIGFAIASIFLTVIVSSIWLVMLRKSDAEYVNVAERLGLDLSFLPSAITAAPVDVVHPSSSELDQTRISNIIAEHAQNVRTLNLAHDGAVNASKQFHQRTLLDLEAEHINATGLSDKLAEDAIADVENEMAALRDAHVIAKHALHESLAVELDLMGENHSTRTADLIATHAEDLEASQTESSTNVAAFAIQIKSLETKLHDANCQNEKLDNVYQVLEKQKNSLTQKLDIAQAAANVTASKLATAQQQQALHDDRVALHKNYTEIVIDFETDKKMLPAEVLSEYTNGEFSFPFEDDFEIAESGSLDRFQQASNRIATVYSPQRVGSAWPGLKDKIGEIHLFVKAAAVVVEAELALKYFYLNDSDELERTVVAYRQLKSNGTNSVKWQAAHNVLFATDTGLLYHHSRRIVEARRNYRNMLESLNRPSLVRTFDETYKKLDEYIYLLDTLPTYEELCKTWKEYYPHRFA